MTYRRLNSRFAFIKALWRLWRRDRATFNVCFDAGTMTSIEIIAMDGYSVAEEITF